MGGGDDGHDELAVLNQNSGLRGSFPERSAATYYHCEVSPGSGATATCVAFSMA
jgi:hypothetical protein